VVEIFRYAPSTAVRLGPPCRRPILIATKYLLFREQDTKSQEMLFRGSGTGHIEKGQVKLRDVRSTFDLSLSLVLR
jgi:hypothetical protein